MGHVVRQSTTRELVFGATVEVEILKDFVNQLPDTAQVRISTFDGDAREPSQTTITARWEGNL